jgi:glycosyltransferase involved in cell wall biosynthesis
MAQTFTDFELLVIADGCEKTWEILQHYPDDRVTVIMIRKQPLWSGGVRNRGIASARGELITYLDTDDKLGKDHLAIINEDFGDRKWVYYNDYAWNGKEFVERECSIEKNGHNGTANVTHRRDMNCFWQVTGYSHDWQFIRGLKKNSANFAKIRTPEYFVCHIPGVYDI